MPENVLSIDRTKPIGPLSSNGATYTVVSEDPASLTLTSVDLSRVNAATDILDIDVDDFARANELTMAAIKDIKSSGGILLDAGVALTLLANPNSIPVGWMSIAGDESSASGIEFVGTIFKKEGTEELYYLRMLSSRGVWDFYFSSVDSETELAHLAESGKGSHIRLHRVAAVLIPENR